MGRMSHGKWTRGTFDSRFARTPTEIPVGGRSFEVCMARMTYPKSYKVIHKKFFQNSNLGLI
jgi:hypothetical protein